MAGQALNPVDAPSWYQFIADFDTTYKTFYDNYNAFMALGPFIQNEYPDMVADYSSILQQASDAAYQLEKLKATRDYVASWIQWLQTGVADVGNFLSSSAQAVYDAAKSRLGLSGLDCSRDLQSFSGFGNLGVLPAIAWAAITIGAAYATLQTVNLLISKFYDRSQRYNLFQEEQGKLISNGVPSIQASQQASRIVEQTYGALPSNEFLGIPWQLLVYGAMAIFLGPPLIDMLSQQQSRRGKR